MVGKLEKKDDANEESMKHEFECLMESLTCDQDKVLKVGGVIADICTKEEFTAFEMCSMCATLMVGACRLRAMKLGLESSKVFWEHMCQTLTGTMDDMFKEIEHGKCKDGDCNCKC